ncbi:PHB depolymerase family esterase [Variovorax sp. RTB1]|uniref:extracellular catalytic domain type 1 short-chain-length polyhydroxyalkanoate depolymerase n=1 Tax=Variovorax sp. RTB1 TaxID=3048631 RepID=UPI002B22B591|nr:PHB depolymerase family esterase [Variovorax sp. RTB1]MEB0110466.1 PHB depolymerase family esterase [Variovorax sp. RTB1]
MNNLFQKLMTEATKLTHSGQLQAATDAIQRALRGATQAAQTAASQATSAFESSNRAKPDAAARTTPPDNTSVVLDGCTRMVDTPAVAAPEAEALPEQWTDGSFTHQGRTLDYKLYVPPSAAATPGSAITPRPLLLMLHGCTQDPADFAAGTQMNTLARELGVVVLYPAQTQHANAQRCWNWFKPQHQQRGRGEPALLVALTESVMAENHVDPARVYVAGLSAGGAMADILGRCYPDIFAGVGVHSGLPSGAATDVMAALSVMRSGAGATPHAAASSTSSTNTASMPPLIVFHGDADSTVNPRNGDAVVDAAVGANPSTPRIAEGSSTAGQRFTRTVYAPAPGRNTVEHWRLHGGGHAWSGGSSQGSFTQPNGADASAEMLRFFLAHPLRCEPVAVQ